MAQKNNPEILRVAVCQMTSTDDYEQNCQQVREFCTASVKQKAELICFPENSLFIRLSRSQPVHAIELQDPFLLELSDFAKMQKVAILLGSVALRDAKGIANATIFMSPASAAQVVYRKIHLFDVDVKGQPAVRESDTFYHGETPRVLEVNGWRIGLSICYDLRFAELYSRYAAGDQIDIIFVPSAFLVTTGQAHWHVLLRARAIENQVYVLAPAQAGVHIGKGGDKRETYGHSLAIGPWGEIVGELDGSQKSNMVIELHKSRLAEVRAQIPMVQHRRLTRTT